MNAIPTPACSSKDDAPFDLPSVSPAGWYPETRWSRVIRAQHGSEQAREELARQYHSPLYYHALRYPLSVDDAKDLVQGFFERHFWSAVINKGQQERGKLRTFLLKAFNDFHIDERRKARARKRGGGVADASLDADDAPQVADDSQNAESLQRAFDRDWAITLWERTLDTLSAHWNRAGKGEQLTTLFQHGILNRNPRKLARPDYAALSADLGKTEGAARVLVCDLRKEVTATMVEEVRQTLTATDSPEQDAKVLKEEVSYLLQVLYTQS